jgi:SH3-like domain-containing protein
MTIQVAMRMRSFFLAGACLLLLVALPAAAKNELPLPRYVSIKSPEANIRSGPGLRYPVHWVIVKKAVPVEVIAEYENWRKIRDMEGEEGWVHRSMLANERTVSILHGTQTLYEDPKPDSSPVAFVEEGVYARLEKCNENWCRVNADGHTGWVIRKAIWGVYPGEEKIDD